MNGKHEEGRRGGSYQVSPTSKTQTNFNKGNNYGNDDLTHQSFTAKNQTGYNSPLDNPR